MRHIELTTFDYGYMVRETTDLGEEILNEYSPDSKALDDLWTLINALDKVESLKVIDGRLYLAFYEYNKDTFVVQTVEVVAAGKFKDSLTSEFQKLADRYDDVAAETRENIEAKKKEYLKPENVSRLAQKFSKNYWNERMIWEIDSSIIGGVLCHIESNRDAYTKLNWNSVFVANKKMISNQGATLGICFIAGFIFPMAFLAFLVALGIIGVYDCIGINLMKRDKEEELDGLISSLKKRIGDVDYVRDIFLGETFTKDFESYLAKDMALLADSSVSEKRNLLDKIEDLRKYVASLEHGDVYAHRVSLLNILASIECAMAEIGVFARETTDFIPTEQVFFSKSEISDRLSYMISETDSGYQIDDAKSAIKRIYRCPYTGCEKELLSMLKAIGKYVVTRRDNKEATKVLFLEIERIEDEAKCIKNSIVGEDGKEPKKVDASYQLGMETSETNFTI